MAVKSAGGAGEKRADDEGDDFVMRGVEADGFGGDFVVVGGKKAAAVGGVDQTGDDEDGEGDEGEDPENRSVSGDTIEAEGAAEELHVLNDDADDFAEAEGDEGEVVTFESEGRDADEEAGERCEASAGEEGAEEQAPLLEGGTARVAEESRADEEGKSGGGVGADGHEAGVAEGKLTGEAVY